ncbi:DNA-binding protein [Paraburkholderia caribensis]|uniref:DNA-binding protein n=1 Tax=Paraburkholderia caribensis TaxID=75105 RepID=UPI0034D17CBE
MARDASITQDQVSRAAEEIRETGGRPTARAIRERLGAGSMATVLKFLQAWQDAQVRPAETPVTLPQPLQRGLLDFVAAEVERSKTELRAELDVANQTNADLILESERQGLMIENLTASLERVHGEKAEMSGRLDQVVNERDAANHEAAAERQAAESARTELAKALLRLDAMPRLEKEIEELRGQLAAERAGRTEAEQEAAVAAARLEAAVDARKVADALLDEAKNHAQVNEAEAKNFAQAKEAEISALRKELKAAQSVASDLRERLAASAANRRRTRRVLPPTAAPKPPRE